MCGAVFISVLLLSLTSQGEAQCIDALLP